MAATTFSCRPSMYCGPPGASRASSSGPSVLPGSPKMCLTPKRPNARTSASATVKVCSSGDEGGWTLGCRPRRFLVAGLQHLTELRGSLLDRIHHLGDLGARQVLDGTSLRLGGGHHLGVRQDALEGTAQRLEGVRRRVRMRHH